MSLLDLLLLLLRLLLQSCLYLCCQTCCSSSVVVCCCDDRFQLLLSLGLHAGARQAPLLSLYNSAEVSVGFWQWQAMHFGSSLGLSSSLVSLMGPVPCCNIWTLTNYGPASLSILFV